MKDNLWLAFSRMSHPSYDETVRTFVRGKGAHLFDSKGNQYFDAFSTLWTNLVGHGRDEIIDAMTEQLRKLSFMHLFTGTQHEPALQLSEKLTALSPFEHEYCFFGCSGSDATDTAIKLARHYWSAKGQPQKNIIVGRRSTYHGTTFGALTLMGHDDYQEPYAPLVGRMHRLPPTDYDAFEQYFKTIDAKKNVAAILVEPIITSDGLILPPKDYWPRIQNLCRDHNVLLIADEVSTGMGRTGELYASSLYGLKPDIVYLAKSLTSGYAPLSALMTSKAIFDAINSNGGYFPHGSTFSGHPVACVAALKVIEIVLREKLVEKANHLGSVLKTELERELVGVDHIGPINGKGTLFEIAILGDKGKQLSKEKGIEVGMKLYTELLSRGQYVRVLGGFMCIAPPLVSTDDEIKELAASLKSAMLKLNEKRSLWS